MKKAIIACSLVIAAVCALSYAQSVGDYTPASRDGGAEQAQRDIVGASGAIVITAQVDVVQFLRGASTATVQNAKSIGEYLTIINGVASNIYIANSGNVKIKKTWTGGQYDVISLYALETNVWIRVGEEDN